MIIDNNANILKKQSCQKGIISNKKRKLLIFLFAIMAILQSGLRDIRTLHEDNDTLAYLYMYNRISTTSWEQLIHYFSFYSVDYGERDLGYPIFVKISQMLCDNFTFFMFLTATFFIIPLSILIYKFVKSYLGIILAFLIYFALYTNIVNSFMRQAIALSVILFCIPYIINSDWKKYFMGLMIAFVIHSSAIAAIPLYFLPHYFSSRKCLLYALLTVPILMSFSPLLVRYITVGTVYEIYGSSNQLAPIYYMFFLFIASFLTYIYYNRVIIVNNSHVLIGCVVGSTLLMPIIWMGGTIIRIGYYYTLFIAPLLPVIIDNIQIGKYIRIIIYIIGISFFIYYISK